MMPREHRWSPRPTAEGTLFRLMLAGATFALGGDLPVRRLGLGALRLTGPGGWGPPQDRAAAKALLRCVVALGVNLIDTADSYGPWSNEELIAEALHPYPNGIVIASKGGLRRTGPSTEMWPADCRPEHLRVACEGSLRRLRVDRIDLYQLHAVDPAVPLEESLGALADLQREGKIRHIGVSSVTVEEFSRARAVASVVSVQNRYNVTDRACDDVLAACEQAGIAFLAWQPLALGALAEVGGPLAAIARDHGATAAQVALAWLLQRSPVVLPIPGTGSIEHLEENVEASRLMLGQDELTALESLGV